MQSVIGLYRITYEVCMNFKQSRHVNSFLLVLEKLCQIDRKLKLDKIKSTSAQCMMKLTFS